MLVHTDRNWNKRPSFFCTGFSALTKFPTETEIFYLTYTALNGQAPSYLKEFIAPYHKTRSVHSQDVGLLGSQKVDWEPEPPRSSCHVESSLILGLVGKRPCLSLRLGLKCYFFEMPMLACLLAQAGS